LWSVPAPTVDSSYRVVHIKPIYTQESNILKDIIEEALECDVQQDGTKTVSSDEFGPPQCLYVGIGNRGIKRLRSKLAPRGKHSDSRQEVESVITRVAFQSGSDRTPDEPNQIDQYIDDLQALADLDMEIDCCFITADIDEPSVIADVLAVVETIQTSFIIAMLTTNTNQNIDITDQFHDSVGTTIVIKDAESRFDRIESLAGSRSSSTDQLVHRLVTDFITLFVCPNRVGVDYARVWAQWDGGRSAVPFVGKFHQSEIRDPEYPSPNLFVGSSSRSSFDWFGYAWIGPSFTLADFEHFRESLDSTLRSNRKDRCGILGCGVDEQLEESVFVSGVQFMDSDVQK